MAVAAQIFVDLDSFSASAPYPLTLSGDGDGATPDVVLEGELPHGGRYLYSLELEAQRDYRFTTSGVADGFTERALLVDRGTGQVLWANAAAALELGLDADSAARFEAGWLRPEAPAGCLLSIWSDPAEPADPLTNAVPFLFEVYVDPVDDAPHTDDAVYRFFDPARGIERFTASEAVRDELLQAHPELRYDGVAFIGDDQAREGWVGVHEVLDHATGRYHYTTSAEERDALLAGLAQAEDLGVAFHVPGEPGENTQPVYRMLDLDTRTWFLTADPIERLYLVLQGNWSDQGVAFNAWAPPAPQEPGVQPADAPAEPSALPQDATQDVSLIGLSGIDAPLL